MLTQLRWRKTGLTVHKDIYKQDCRKVKECIHRSKSEFFRLKIVECDGNQRKLFNIVDSLLGRGKPAALPTAANPSQLAESFNVFFINKIATIRTNLCALEYSTSDLSFSLDTVLEPCAAILSSFVPSSDKEIEDIVQKSSKASCNLDPIPTGLLVSILPQLLPVMKVIVNLALSSGKFPSSLKSAIVKPLLKKNNLDPEIYKNYRPVSNLSFVSKVIEKVVAARILQHMKNNNILDVMQSAYKSSHSTESALNVFTMTSFL